ncbi:hypothetical protein [Nocardia sp. NPDC048505]|uniref:hypothetical protein n=1 Tax=unclassified Nocardia TaxID=2637762 RepID=UPI0033E014CF
MMLKKLVVATLMTMTALLFGGGAVQASAHGPEDSCWNGCTFEYDPNHPPNLDPTTSTPTGHFHPRDRTEISPNMHPPSSIDSALNGSFGVC